MWSDQDVYNVTVTWFTWLGRLFWILLFGKVRKTVQLQIVMEASAFFQVVSPHCILLEVRMSVRRKWRQTRPLGVSRWMQTSDILQCVNTRGGQQRAVQMILHCQSTFHYQTREPTCKWLTFVNKPCFVWRSAKWICKYYKERNAFTLD